jgi:hypothetical protein
MKEEKLPKLSKYEHQLAIALIDSLQSWKSSTAVTTGEFYKLVKRLSNIKRR